MTTGNGQLTTGNRRSYNAGMAGRPTYSLQILLGTIAAFAVAAGAFAAPESIASGLLVLIVAMCGPGLLIVVWRSGRGYRRSFVIGAAVPSVMCACRYWTVLAPGAAGAYMSPPDVALIIKAAVMFYRPLAMLLFATALGGGLAGMGVHWLMKACEADTSREITMFRKGAVMDADQAATPREAKANRRRRWLQFRLKWLLIFITVLAVPLSWLGWKLEEKRRERWAKAELKKFSVFLLSDAPVPDEDPFGADEKPPGPAWLRRMLGDDFFIHVESVRSWPSKLDPDIDLEELSYPAQEGMSDEPPLNDAGLVYLRHLPKLRGLSLDGCEVTDAGLPQLYSLSRLESLSLIETKVSPNAVAELRKALPHCEISYERVD